MENNEFDKSYSVLNPDVCLKWFKIYLYKGIIKGVEIEAYECNSRLQMATFLLRERTIPEGIDLLHLYCNRICEPCMSRVFEFMIDYLMFVEEEYSKDAVDCLEEVSA